MDRLIVALGNPGMKYESTKHNIGWLALDAIKKVCDLTWKEKFKGVYAAMDHNGDKVYFLKPLTFMNLSGESIGALIKFFKIDPKNVLVVHDELDLVFGKVEFKDGGGLAGHNGLKSTAEHLGTRDFKRLRLGIGRPLHGDVSSWVLSPFSGDERIALDQYLENAGKVIEEFIEIGFDKIKPKYTKKLII